MRQKVEKQTSAACTPDRDAKCAPAAFSKEPYYCKAQDAETIGLLSLGVSDGLFLLFRRRNICWIGDFFLAFESIFIYQQTSSLRTRELTGRDFSE